MSNMRPRDESYSHLVSATPSATFPFLDLPIELRYTIYEELLRSDPPQDYAKRFLKATHYWLPLCSWDLANTCEQMYRECLSVVLRRYQDIPDSQNSEESISTNNPVAFFVHRPEGFDCAMDGGSERILDHFEDTHERDLVHYTMPRITSDDLEHINYLLDTLSTGDRARFLSRPLDVYFYNFSPYDMLTCLSTSVPDVHDFLLHLNFVYRSRGNDWIANRRGKVMMKEVTSWCLMAVENALGESPDRSWNKQLLKKDWNLKRHRVELKLKIHCWTEITV